MKAAVAKAMGWGRMARLRNFGLLRVDGEWQVQVFPSEAEFSKCHDFIKDQVGWRNQFIQAPESLVLTIAPGALQAEGRAFSMVEELRELSVELQKAKMSYLEDGNDVTFAGDMLNPALLFLGGRCPYQEEDLVEFGGIRLLVSTRPSEHTPPTRMRLVSTTQKRVVAGGRQRFTAPAKTAQSGRVKRERTETAAEKAARLAVEAEKAQQYAKDFPAASTGNTHPEGKATAPSTPSKEVSSDTSSEADTVDSSDSLDSWE